MELEENGLDEHNLKQGSDNDNHTEPQEEPAGWQPNGTQEACQIIDGATTINLASNYLRADILASVGMELFNRVRKVEKKKTREVLI